MKKLDSYLTEKLVISKDIIKKPNYKYHPKNRSELIDLLLKLLEKRGGDADLNDIDVSKITDMSSLFYEVNRVPAVENIDISKWNVSNVTNMNSMFYKCYNFNCDLSEWDVSNVTDMAWMFNACHEFNCDLSSWDVSNVTDMTHMFEYCRTFDTSTTKNWKVIAKGKNVQDMFHGAIKGDIPDWWWWQAEK